MLGESVWDRRVARAQDVVPLTTLSCGGRTRHLSCATPRATETAPQARGRARDFALSLSQRSEAAGQQMITAAVRLRSSGACFKSAPLRV